jgi:hypothetical protein
VRQAPLSLGRDSDAGCALRLKGEHGVVPLQFVGLMSLLIETRPGRLTMGFCGDGSGYDPYG